MSWGRAALRRRRYGIAVWLVRHGPAVLGSFALGVGIRAALSAPAAVPGVTAYVAWVWPEGRSSWEVFAASLGRQLGMGPGIAWLAGLTVVGAPLALAAAALRGYLAGLAVVSAMVRWGEGGAFAVALGLIPSHLLGLCAAARAAQGAMPWAADLVRAVHGSAQADLPASFRRYARAGLASLALAGAAAGAEVAAAAAIRTLLSGTPWGV